MMRLEGWELRLDAAIEAARARPYALGEHDCFRLACTTVAALTGVDHWPRFAGRYRTRAQAQQLIRAHGGSFTAAFSGLFGSEPVPIVQSRRGDVAEFRDREAHLGVVLGAEVAVLGERGLAFVPACACAHAWRIG